MNSSPSILIVGGGPSGLVLASCLLRSGLKVRIIDKEPSYGVGQRARAIKPRTLEAYQFMGVLPDMLNEAISMFPMQNYEGGEISRTWFMGKPVDPTPETPYPISLMLGQDRTEEILRQNLAKYSAHVELGTELLSFTQDANGVTAELSKNQDGEEVRETVQVDWLVGADGAKGIVRKQLGLTFLGETREGQRIIICDVNIKGLDREHWHMWGDLTTTLVSIRPSQSKLNDIFTIMVGGRDVDYTNLLSNYQTLFNFIIAFTGRKNLEFGEVIWFSDWRPNIRMVNKFSEGRVFVVGDAAHVHSPTGGQGMNSGIQDSVNLAWKLALVTRSLAPPTLLASYNEERLPVIAEMLHISTELLDKTFTNATTKTSTPWVRGRELFQLGVNYRWSSVVLASGERGVVDAYGQTNDGELSAGDRAPGASGLVDIKSGRALVLFEIYDTKYHTVLIFSSKPAPFLDALRKYPAEVLRSVVVLSQGAVGEVEGADFVLEDKEGHAHRVYVHGSDQLVVVRPDGIVGALTDKVEGIEQYFKLILA